MVGVARQRGQPSHINTVGLFVCGPVDWSSGELWWSMNSDMNMDEIRQSSELDSMVADLCVTPSLKSFRQRGKRYFVGHINAEMQAIQGNVICSSEETLFFIIFISWFGRGQCTHWTLSRKYNWVQIHLWKTGTTGSNKETLICRDVRLAPHK